MAASGNLESKNDGLILDLLKDPNYKVTGDGKIFTKLTLNGQGISDDWREMGYVKPDGYIRIRYKDDFLFVQRVIFQKYKGDLQPDMVIDHDDRDRSNNHPSNLKMKPQSENNKNKTKKYKKNKKSRIIGKLREFNMLDVKASLERIINSHLDEKASFEFKTAAEEFESKVELDIDLQDFAKIVKVKYEDLDSILTKEVEIKWSASFIYRDWGFNVSVSVPDQKVVVSYEYLVDDKTEEKEITLNMKDIEIEYKENKGKQVGVVPFKLKISDKKYILHIQTTAA